MKIVIGNDHGGVTVKPEILKHLDVLGHEVINVGVDSEDRVDYPDMAQKACDILLSGKADFGILLCGTGIGISIAANKIKGIRCALIHDLYTAEMAKAHNEANFLAFGGRVNYPTPIADLLDKFFETTPMGGRHMQRIHKISALENSITEN